MRLAPALRKLLDRGSRLSHLLHKGIIVPPLHLRDYVCHAIGLGSPDPLPLHDASSGTSYPLSHFISYDKFSSFHRAYLAAITSGDEPRHFSHAVQDSRWREAMASEISALEANHTWDLRPLPPGTKALGCKCVYKIKYHADGSVERFKARVVVLGNHQVEGEDFHETFAAVAKMVTVRTLLTLAVAKSWSLHQMDIHNAFLHGDLREDIYMKVPPGFQTPQPNMVCKLRSLYMAFAKPPDNGSPNSHPRCVTMAFSSLPLTIPYLPMTARESFLFSSFMWMISSLPAMTLTDALTSNTTYIDVLN